MCRSLERSCSNWSYNAHRSRPHVGPNTGTSLAHHTLLCCCRIARPDTIDTLEPHRSSRYRTYHNALQYIPRDTHTALAPNTHRRRCTWWMLGKIDNWDNQSDRSCTASMKVPYKANDTRIGLDQSRRRDCCSFGWRGKICIGGRNGRQCIFHNACLQNPARIHTVPTNCIDLFRCR